MSDHRGALLFALAIDEPSCNLLWPGMAAKACIMNRVYNSFVRPRLIIQIIYSTSVSITPHPAITSARVGLIHAACAFPARVSPTNFANWLYALAPELG